jgi:DNA-binding MarR family transcriptional regulator
MSQQLPPQDTILAAALLTIVPKVLRRLRADLLFLEEEKADVCVGLREMSELRATPGQLTLLSILVECERCMMQELAEQLVVTPSTVTAMIKRLLALGYVERCRDDADWRTVWVVPTERGRQVVDTYNRAALVSFQRRLAQLSDDERQKLGEALPALRHLIDE